MSTVSSLGALTSTSLRTNTSATRQGRVVVNCHLDRDEMLRRQRDQGVAKGDPVYNTGSNDDTMGIDIMDLVFTKNQDKHGRGRNDFRIDSLPMVFSSGNGLYKKKKGDSNDKARVEMREDYTFVGVSDGRDDFTSRNDNRHIARTAVPVQIGGVHTIRNTGKDDIKQFKFVCWDAPLHGNVTKRFSGVSAAKKLFSVHEFKYDNEATDKKRIIGLALSNAHPGEEFDILLGKYCV